MTNNIFTVYNLVNLEEQPKIKLLHVENMALHQLEGLLTKLNITYEEHERIGRLKHGLNKIDAELFRRGVRDTKSQFDEIG